MFWGAGNCPGPGRALPLARLRRFFGWHKAVRPGTFKLVPGLTQSPA